MKKTLIKVLKWAGILIAAGGAMAVINDFKASSTKRAVSKHLQDAGIKSPSTSQGYTPQPEQPKQQEYDDFEYYGDWWT